jgi:AbrB family looped-hinge helix DNA binding protein
MEYEMFRTRVKLGKRGQLVIPKIIRESLGLKEESYVVLEVSDKKLEVRPLDDDVVNKWASVAKTEGLDVTKTLTYGDKLYEKVFLK